MTQFLGVTHVPIHVMHSLCNLSGCSLKSQEIVCEIPKLPDYFPGGWGVGFPFFNKETHASQQNFITFNIHLNKGTGDKKENMNDDTYLIFCELTE